MSNSEQDGKKKNILFAILAIIAIGAYNFWFSAEARSDACVKEGNAFKEEGKYDEAFAAYSKAIELNSQNAKAYMQRGDLYVAIGAHEVAQKSIDDPEIPINQLVEILLKQEAKRQDDYTHALEIYNRALGNDPHNSYLHGRRGQVYLELEDYTNALVDFTAALQDEKASEFTKSSAYFGRGYIYQKQKDIVSAIENYTKAIEFNSGSEAYNNRGNCYKEQGNVAQAVADYTKAIELNPNDALYYENRGKAHRQLGNTAQADADSEKAKELRQKQ